MENDTKGGWQAFGQGVQDSAVNLKDLDVILAVDWNESKWGVGSMFTLKDPFEGKTITKIRMKVKSLNGSACKIYAGVATSDDANLVYSREQAIEVTKEWKEVTFSVTAMKKDKPNAASRPFTEGDYAKIQIIKVLFSKPDPITTIKDQLMFRNPSLILSAED